MINPILISLPKQIETPRLIIRPPQMGDELEHNRAFAESHLELREWLPWAQEIPSLEESEITIRGFMADWILRKDLVMFIFEKQSHQFLGGTGLHRIDWQIPRFEIGYWMRTSQAGKGYITESTNALLRFALEGLKAARVEIRCSSKNVKSESVMKRLHLEFEGTLKKNFYNPQGPRIDDTQLYAAFDTKSLPPLAVKWG
ncbi:MAG: GNAT family N-acetyltransferase [Bacteriovoracaceae bacterium]|nr:GNAT family N-acetyltransferase [Bacteriovoracaceae bacterium]